MSLNAEDDGARRFILIECEDYADEITAERLRRIINGIEGSKSKALSKGYSESFTYYSLGDPFDIASILSGNTLPNFTDMATFMLYTATGQNIVPF